jgi:hypothetical protein
VKGEIFCVRDLLTGRLRRVCVRFGIRAQKGSFLSVEEKRRIHHVAKEKGQANTRSTRGEGNVEKKR